MGRGAVFGGGGLAQCMFNLYIAKEIPTGKNTIKIAQLFCIFLVLIINII